MNTAIAKIDESVRRYFLQALYTRPFLQTADAKKAPKRDVRRMRLASTGGDRVWKDEDIKRACALLVRTLFLQCTARRE